MSHTRLYLPWKSDKAGNITCSAILDLLREIGQVDPELADYVVNAVNTHEALESFALKMAKGHQIACDYCITECDCAKKEAEAALRSEGASILHQWRKCCASFYGTPHMLSCKHEFTEHKKED